MALLVALSQGLDLIEAAIGALRRDGRPERLTVVTDFLLCRLRLMPRLAALRTAVAGLDVRVLTTQAEIDPREASISLIAFGDGAWLGCDADLLFPRDRRYGGGTGAFAANGGAAAALAGVPLIHLEGGQGRWLDWTGWLGGRDRDAARGRPGPAARQHILVIHAARRPRHRAGLAPAGRPPWPRAGLVAALDREVLAGAGLLHGAAEGAAAEPAGAPVPELDAPRLSPPARSGSPPGSRAAPAAGSA
ncbi:MAG: hypothetical protein U1E17_08990 [Geminicoccaceae bacterium]